jgi:excisionase family DNA binding protein
MLVKPPIGGKTTWVSRTNLRPREIQRTLLQFSAMRTGAVKPKSQLEVIQMITGSLDEARGASKITAVSDSGDGVSTLKRRLLSKRELAAVLNVSERTIENWLSQKRIPRLRLSARLTRFNLAKVEAALARYEVKKVGARR